MIGLDQESLDRFAAQIAGHAGENDEWMPADRRLKLEFVQGGSGCARVLYTTKLSWLSFVDCADDVSTGEAAIFGRPGLLTPAYVSCVAAEAVRCRAEIVFAGDLDPLDLTVFLSLAIGLQSHGLSARYIGIGDQWLDICSNNISGALPTIPLSLFEREFLHELEKLEFDFETIVGKKAMALLRQGQKLELEGATNKRIYEKGLSPKIEQLAFRG